MVVTELLREEAKFIYKSKSVRQQVFLKVYKVLDVKFSKNLQGVRSTFLRGLLLSRRQVYSKDLLKRNFLQVGRQYVS